MKRTLRVTSLLLALVLCLSLLPASALAAGETEGTVIDSGTCGDNVTWKLTDDGTLTISGTGAMYDYEETFDRVDDIYYVVSSAPWGSHHLYELTHKLVIEPGVTHIGSYAFGCMRRIESVALPNTLESIGEKAFYACRTLTSIELPDSITEFGKGVFYMCTNLSSVQLPNTMTCIRANMFRYCEKLQSIVIPDSVTVIGDYAFSSCYKLETVVMPEHYVKVYPYSFSGCRVSLLSVTKQPKNCLVQLGRTATFTTEAYGQDFTYTWYYRNPGDDHYTRTTCHEPTYEIQMTEARNGRKMYCRIENRYGYHVDTKTVVMGTMQVILDKEYLITRQPKDIQAEQVGDSVTLKIGVKSSRYTIYYYWYYMNPTMSEFKPCKESTSPSYTLAVTEARNGRQMYCRVYGDGRYLTSNIVTLTYKNASPGAVPEDEK